MNDARMACVRKPGTTRSGKLTLTFRLAKLDDVRVVHPSLGDRAERVIVVLSRDVLGVGVARGRVDADDEKPGIGPKTVFRRGLPDVAPQYCWR